MSKIKVAVADDNKDFCDILCDVLYEQKDMEICWTANDGRKVLEEIERISRMSSFLTTSCLTSTALRSWSRSTKWI